MADTQPFSIRIFVADGDPDGLRVIERSNWNGRALIFPRSLLPEIKKREEFDRSVFTAMAGLGLTALTIPEQYGGAGFYEGKMANQAASIALEEVNRWCASTGVTLSVHMSLFSSLLTKWGNDEQKARVLPKMASGEWLGAYCLSEAGSGTDAGSLACEAKKDGDEYVLNGSKLWITSAPYADVFIVLARTSHEHKTRGITAFLVEADRKGVVIGNGFSHAAAIGYRYALHRGHQVLDGDGNARKRQAGIHVFRFAPGLLIKLRRNRIYLRIYLLDPCNRGLDQLRWRDIAISNKFRQPGRVVGCQKLVYRHRLHSLTQP